MLHRLAARSGGDGCVRRKARCLVSYGGDGEGSALVRERTCSLLGFLGGELDRARKIAGLDGRVVVDARAIAPRLQTGRLKSW
jgi:acetate kinase